MAVALGKRKRTETKREESRQSNDEDARARALFQRAFEAKFKPLEKKPVKAPTPPVESEDDDDDDESDSDWSGISDGEDALEVVEHDVRTTTNDELARMEMKGFMSSKPPLANSGGILRIAPSSAEDPEEDDEGEASNLKHDLALQRLLKESHLLDSAAFSNSPSAGPEGKLRIKALDLRLQSLGAKQSLAEQQKMPLAHRKGIKEKSTAREAARRKEAAENGIILEKAKASMGPTKKFRQKGVDAPSVGKFRGGTLKLSAKDVRSIEGPKVGGKGQRKGRRR